MAVGQSHLISAEKIGRVALWLVTCARKPKVPGSSPAVLPICRGQLSVVIDRLKSNCL